MRRNAGFTLIEMMVVIAIIGVILAIAVPSFAAAGKKAQEKACLANLRLIEAQMENYHLDNQAYPLQDQGSPSTENIFEELVAEGYLKEVPVEPSGGTYTIQYSGSPVKFTLECSIHEHTESSESAGQ
jgi:type II secretion system protein G